MSRYEVMFSLRYAVRVLERYARLWARIDLIVRLGSLLAGSSAIAGLVSGSVPLSLTAGICFAVLQAIEFAAAPSRKSVEALAARKPYAMLVARQGSHDDASLETAYHLLVAEDDVIVPETLRALAYNDAAEERNCAPEHLYALTLWQRLVAVLA